MFSRSSNETKIAVLEERLTSYEVMMKKIDEAIQIMGKTSQNISKMLAVHEEKLENNGKNDELIIDRIKTIEVKNTEDHTKVIERFELLEEKIDDRIGAIDKKVDEVTKFRWLVVGALVIVSFVFSQSNMVVDILTPDANQVILERTK
jgi:DNA repair exonuclease SbcCD ATPase subunit